MTPTELATELQEIKSMLQQLLSANGPTPPSAYLPGGVEWFVNATEEERRAYNRKRAISQRKKRKVVDK